VENRRDRGLATLVQAALEASPIPETRPTQPEFDRNDTKVEEVEFAEVDATEDRAPPDESPTNWPRLRLAVVSEASGPESVPSDADPATIVPASRAWHDTPTGVERPILIVEDETAAANYAGPPVRRLAYQHLFSRLRSG
jgi:hypothetical protein